MTTLDKIVDLPDHMTQDEQDVCTQRILNELNKRVKGNHFTEADLAPIQMASWPSPRMGLLRGGGYNIRIVQHGLAKGQLEEIEPGRFATVKDWLTDGLSPSLHLVGTVNGAQLLLKTDDSVDFTAHIDSDDAFFPAGAIAHLFVDVIGHASRHPCPAP
jgi:hypothetical protein